MTDRNSQIPEAVVPAKDAHVVELASGTLGALGGAATGAAMGGPVGAAVGALIGAAMGAASGWGADQASSDEDAIAAALDEEIGVTKGPIGAPNLEHPPAPLNAPSAAAAGVGGAQVSAEHDAAGPMQMPDD